VSGAEAFQSFSSILPTIRDLYAGRFDREEGGNPDMKFELADKTGREEILRSLLENEGLVQIKDRVLVLYKLINTQKKYGGHSSPLCSLLGRIQGLNGAVIFKSFSSILQPIRDLYAGRFDWEEGGNLDMKFEFADQDGRQEILRALLEAQGVLKIEKRDEKGSPVRVLVWLKTINPNKGYGGHSSFLCTLLGRIQGVSGAKPFQSFPSILQPIRDLYAGKFDHEEWLIPKPTEE
jgi:hypothetical protein